MIQEPISCRGVNTFAARWEPFAARTAAVFKRAVFYLAAYIDNNVTLLDAPNKVLNVFVITLYLNLFENSQN